MREEPRPDDTEAIGGTNESGDGGHVVDPEEPDDLDSTDDLVEERSTGDEDSLREEPHEAEPAEGEVLYDCTSWAGESRALLASLLDSNGVPHAWQGTTVSIREEDEELVDDLIDEVLASARPALDRRVPKVVYAVGAWPAAMQTSLADSLTVADIPYEWDENGDLVVYEEHEEDVEAILEEMPDPDDSEAGTDDGLALHDVLDRLFLESQKLARRPDDAGAVVGVADAVERLERMSRPFGFEPPEWKNLVGRASALRDALEADPGDDAALDDDGLRDMASAVRDLVHQYV